jgi:heme-degrading monooxygenase HmoA
MQNKYLNLIFTNHAISRLYNRGITQEKAYEVFAHPDGQLEGKIPGSVKFYKSYGQQRIELIAKKNDKDEWVVLSSWARLKEKSSFRYQEPFLERIIGKLVRKIFK